MDETAGRKRRRWPKRLGVAGAVGGLLLASMPVWWPWILVPVLEHKGVSVGDYKRSGLVSLELHDLGFTNVATEFHAQRLVVQLPHRWLIDRWSGHDASGSVQAGLTNWLVRILPADADNHTPGDFSLSVLLDQVGGVLQSARPWIEQLGAGNGEIQYAGRTTRVERLTVLDDSIAAEIRDDIPKSTAELTVRFPRPRYFQVDLALPEGAVRAGLTLTRGEQTWMLAGDVEWQTNAASLNAVAAPDGWLPQSLNITGTNWIVPAGLIGLEGYRELGGHFAVGWTNQQYHFVVQGTALPAVTNPLVPDRIEVDVAGQGNLEALLVERLNIETPVLQASLSDPLAVDFRGRMLVPAATLRVDARFDRDAGLPFTGRLEGVVTARPAIDELANADFAVQVNEFSSDWLNVDQLNLDGALHWPQLVVSNAYFTLPAAGTFRTSGELDLLTLSATNVNWMFSGGMPTNLLPADLKIENVAAQGTAAGRWPDLTHRTELSLSRLDWDGSQVERLTASVNGILTGTNGWQFDLRQGDLGARGAGTVDLTFWKQALLAASIHELETVLTTNATLNLEQRVSLEVGWPTNAAGPFKLQLSPLKLAGSGRQLEFSADLEWPMEGRLMMAATNLATADLAGLGTRRLPAVSVRELAVTAGWDRGPVVFSAFADASWQHELIGRVEGHIRARGNADGLEFAPVLVSVDDREALSLTGRIPLLLVPGNAEPVQWLEQGVMEARLKSLAGGPVWNRLARELGLEFVEPEFTLNATGGLDDFRADLEFSSRSVRSFQFINVPPNLTVVSNVQLRAGIDRRMLRVSEGTFELVGEPGRVAAALPLKGDTWTEWLQALRTVDWHQARGELNLPAIDMAMLAPLAGDWLAPAGEAGLALQLAPGGAVRGFATVTNLATRPLEPLGSVRDISGRIDFTDQGAELSSFRANLSGQPLHVGGKASWNPTGLTGASLSLNATNVSLARTVDLFLRGDLDLRLAVTGPEPPLLSGEVRLSNSLLFQDLGGLIAIDLKQPSRRPPFFNVSEGPLADWRLDVRVRGQKFLRVLSPVFKGQVSSAMQVTGTLREPVALGEITVEQGQMIFPFGSLDVARGVIQLTRQNPHEPQVDFRGQGMNFGYQLTADVSGSAVAPVVTFSSVPPLTTREIMLMLTAGEIPSGTYSHTGMDKASKLGYFLGKELIDQFLGLDSGDERLSFRTGEYVTDDGQLTYRIEYRLVDWLSVFGEYSRFRDYNGGFKFNLYSR